MGTFKASCLLMAPPQGSAEPACPCWWGRQPALVVLDSILWWHTVARANMQCLSAKAGHCPASLARRHTRRVRAALQPSGCRVSLCHHLPSLLPGSMVLSAAWACRRNFLPNPASKSFASKAVYLEFLPLSIHAGCSMVEALS